MTVTLPSALDQSRDLVQPSLRSAVARLDPATRSVAAYHFGWSDEEGRETRASGGKAIRSALALLGAAATTGDREAAVPAAVAVELVHNFSLIHDDLMDRDTERRHRPTVWALRGDGLAVLVGDALLSLAYEVLLETGSPHAGGAALLLADSVRELIRGQVADLEFESRASVGAGECESMVIGKTASLLSASSSIGALFTGADAEATDALAEYGHQLGIAFQLVDDLLGLWGEPAVTGKPVFSDLLQHKKTLPITWAIENGGAPGRELAAWLARDGQRPEPDELAHAADLVERAGGRDWAVRQADRRVGLALSALDRVTMPDSCRAEFVDLARFVVERTA